MGFEVLILISVLFLNILIFYSIAINFHSLREYRYGRAVDGTKEWQAFQDAFEVRK